MVDRYRRLRAGVHTTLARQGEHWPPVAGVPVAELARAGRAAGIEVGRETSRNGWDRDPEDRSGLAHRFYGPNGWTTFTVDRSGVGQAPTRARPEAGVRDLGADDRPPMSVPLIQERPDHLGWVLGGGAAPGEPPSPTCESMGFVVAWFTLERAVGPPQRRGLCSRPLRPL